MIKNILTIIPQHDKGMISEISKNKVKGIGKIDIPYNSISKIINNETIITLDKKNKQLLLHTIKGTLFQSLDVPFGITMNVKDRVVYVGGDASEGEVCYLIDLDAEPLAIKNIDLPEPMSYGKAVDDILILEDKMLLIDNIVLPKYTFEYDISIPNKPIWVKTIKLPHGRPYENIIKGDMNKDWMVYLSTSATWDDYESNITIEGKYNNTISSDGKGSILDISLCGNILYTLTSDGLGYFNLNDKKLSFKNIIFIEHRIIANRIIKIDNSCLLIVHQCGYELIYNRDLEHFTGSKKFRFVCNKMIGLNQWYKTFKNRLKLIF